MLRSLSLVVLLLLTSPSAAARTRAIRHAGGIPAPRSVLWVAAHPDDEAVIAPLFYKWCVDDGARCRLLILTRGASGSCQLPQGCAPDVATVRASEAGAASELFGAELVLLRYEDGRGVLPPAWGGAGGSNDESASVRVAKEIDSFDPEVIVTFDPRHGSSCHPDHRETGRLVLDATAGRSTRASVYLLETFLEFSSDGASVQFSNASPASLRFDATQMFASGAEAWSAVVWDMLRHRSQFPQSFVESVGRTPSSQRSVFIAPAEVALASDVRPCR